MPPRRNKRPRSSPPPSPIPSIHSDREESLSPPPTLPTPEALKNVDVVYQILRHVDRSTLAKCLTLSVTFHAAAGRLFYQHVKLSKAEQILKIIQHTTPARTTRKHTSKAMSPLPFFTFTTYITIAFHHDKDLPADYMDKLVAVFPKVRSVHIKLYYEHTCCRRKYNCMQRLWTLASKLPILRISIDLENLGYWHSRYRHNDPEILPLGIHFRSCVLAIVSDNLGRVAFSSTELSADWNSRITTDFAAIHIILCDPNPQKYADKFSPSVSAKNPEIPYYQRQDWSNYTETADRLAQDVLGFISSKPATWELYQINDLFPQEATFWPIHLRNSVLEKHTSVESLIEKGLEKIPAWKKQDSGQRSEGESSTNTAGPEPTIRFKTRAEYLSGLSHPDDLHLPREEVLRWADRTTEDYGEVTGMYGSWELTLPPKPVLDDQPIESTKDGADIQDVLT